jgi:hypothetical protein
MQTSSSASTSSASYGNNDDGGNRMKSLAVTHQQNQFDANLFASLDLSILVGIVMKTIQQSFDRHRHHCYHDQRHCMTSICDENAKVKMENQFVKTEIKNEQEIHTASSQFNFLPLSLPLPLPLSSGIAVQRSN